MKYDEGAWVLTKSKYSVFTWYLGNYKTTIAYSGSCLQELKTHYDFSKFDGFCKRLVSISIYSTSNFAHASLFKIEYPRTGKPMDFN